MYVYVLDRPYHVMVVELVYLLFTVGNKGSLLL